MSEEKRMAEGRKVNNTIGEFIEEAVQKTEDLLRHMPLGPMSTNHRKHLKPLLPEYTGLLWRKEGINDRPTNVRPIRQAQVKHNMPSPLSREMRTYYYGSNGKLQLRAVRNGNDGSYDGVNDSQTQADRTQNSESTSTDQSTKLDFVPIDKTNYDWTNNKSETFSNADESLSPGKFSWHLMADGNGSKRLVRRESNSVSESGMSSRADDMSGDVSVEFGQKGEKKEHVIDVVNDEGAMDIDLEVKVRFHDKNCPHIQVQPGNAQIEIHCPQYKAHDLWLDAKKIWHNHNQYNN